LAVLGVIIDTVIGRMFKEIDVKPSTWAAIEKLNLGKEDLEKLAQVIDFARKNRMGDTFETVIKEFQTNSDLFVNIMKISSMSREFGDDFEFAKLMVTKINPNAILAFKPMFLPLKGKKLNELDDETSEKRKFFVNYFENECDLSLDAFPNVKVKKICEMGFMTKKEFARILEKRNKELNKYAAKSDYTRGSGYTFEL
jgi:predicted HTH domain antitoxin